VIDRQYPAAGHEKQLKTVPTMKRLDHLLALVIAGAFSTFLSNAQETNTLTNGATYIGMMKDGKPNGQGTEMWQNGPKQVGEFKDGNLVKGTETWQDGTEYVGEFRDCMKNGRGTLRLPDGSKYVGDFKNGKYDGQGRFSW